MAKMCWKCGKYHEDGAIECPYCGASFTSDAERYESDGRTISDRDETAYLSSPPPKYRRQHVILPVVIIGVMIVAMVFVVAQGYMGHDDPDVRYNYVYGTAEIIETSSGIASPDDGMQFLIVKCRFYNDDVSGGVSNGVMTWDFSVQCDGRTYSMDPVTYSYKFYQGDRTAYIGYSEYLYEVFQIPEGSNTFGIDLDYEGHGKAVRDPTIGV